MNHIIDITEATVRSDGPDYNKFNFVKGNDNARVMVPSLGIACAMVHSLYRSEAEMVQDDKGRLKPEWEGSTYAGTFLCTGDFEKVSNNPMFGDPENCAACASLLSGPRVADRAKKQYGLNVLRYSTKPNAYDVVSDVVTVELWKHGNDRNIKPIVTAFKESDAEKISHLDFLIETDGSIYKKLSIQPGRSMWRAEGNEGLKNAVVAAMGSLYTDEQLVGALGDKVSKEELAAAVSAAVAQATAGSGVSPNSSAENPFATTAPTEPVVSMVTPGEKTTAEDLNKVDVSSIDSLL